MTVRTDTLAASGIAAAGTTTEYTCPVNVTAIVKDIRVSGTATLNGTVDVRLKRGAVAITVMHVVLAAAGVLTLASLAGGFVVLEPGDTIQVIVAGTAPVVGLWVSGSELAGLAP
jgi:hypothetical protein